MGSIPIALCLPWQKPPDHHFKLNIDGSFKPKTVKGGTGGLIRNHSVQWITEFACKTKVDSAYQAKLLALLHGLTLAKTKNIKKVLVETDSQVLLNSLYIDDALCSNIRVDCRSLLQQLEGPTLHHPPREANGVVDALAEYGRKTKDPTMIVNKLHIFDASPSFATNILEREANGIASARSVPFCMDNSL
ncbi:uncharacterized protein LOC125833151 [Solanum verrucosum]|uniref:uncharacterized protein LOC125833151 n=1 Tax=Solanum verrucosum TaxID=315347 RepID=UPI0020D1597F|nr:uncharacterized protein LOC125833151 [Solanum verrucosum]